MKNHQTAGENGCIRMWHGAQRWQGQPEIRPPSKGQTEHGAGIYTCAHLQTARKYAAGGGRIMDMTLKGDLVLIDDIQAPASALIQAARDIPRLKNRDLIIADLEMCQKKSRDGINVPLEALINLVCNHGAMFGKAAVEVTEFVASQGADALLNTRSNGDDWLVLLNPEVIVFAEHRPAASIAVSEYELPRVRDQIKAFEASRSNSIQSLTERSVERENSEKRLKTAFKP